MSLTGENEQGLRKIVALPVQFSNLFMADLKKLACLI